MTESAMASSPPPGAAPSRRWLPQFLLGAMLVATAAWMTVSVSEHARLMRDIHDSIEQQRYYSAIASRVTATGNATLRFEAFDMSAREQRNFLAAFSTWVTYSAYPRRMFLADENTPVGMGILSDPYPLFSPTPLWLASHDVEGTLVVRRDLVDNRLNFSYMPRIESGKPDHAGTVKVAPLWQVQVVPLIWAMGYLGVLAAVGYALAGLFFSCTGTGGAGTALALGAVGMGLAQFWLSLAGLAPNRAVLASLGLAALAVIILCKRHKHGAPSPRRRLPLTARDWWLLPFGAALVWSCVVAGDQAFSGPFVFMDATGIWGLKAKVVSSAPIAGGGLDGYFHDESLSGSHLDYPLLFPFLSAGLFAAVGGMDEIMVKLPLLYLYVAYGLLVYRCARLWLPREYAAGLTALAACVPHLVMQGTADLPLAVFYAACIFQVLRWIRDGAPPALWLAGIFGAACALTKNEGLPLMLIAFAAAGFFGWRKSARNCRLLSMVFLAALLTLAPWVFFRATLPHTDENYFAHLNWSTFSANVNRVPEIFRTFFIVTFRSKYWAPSAWLAAAAILAGFCRRPSREMLALAFVLAAQLSVYALACIISPYPLTDLLSQTVDRLLLQMFPVGLMLAAASLGQYIPREDAPARMDEAPEAANQPRPAC